MLRSLGIKPKICSVRARPIMFDYATPEIWSGIVATLEGVSHE